MILTTHIRRTSFFRKYKRVQRTTRFQPRRAFSGDRVSGREDMIMPRHSGVWCFRTAFVWMRHFTVKVNYHREQKTPCTFPNKCAKNSEHDQCQDWCKPATTRMIARRWGWLPALEAAAAPAVVLAGACLWLFINPERSIDPSV